MRNSFEEFLHDFRLTPRWSAALFGRSPRTVRRWRRRGRIPTCAQNMVDVVREQTPPINHSLHRGPSVGVLIHAWRERFYGAEWKSWLPPDVRELVRARAEAAALAEAERQAITHARRRESLRRYWRRRR